MEFLKNNLVASIDVTGPLGLLFLGSKNSSGDPWKLYLVACLLVPLLSSQNWGWILKLSLLASDELTCPLVPLLLSSKDSQVFQKWTWWFQLMSASSLLSGFQGLPGWYLQMKLVSSNDVTCLLALLFLNSQNWGWNLKIKLSRFSWCNMSASSPHPKFPESWLEPKNEGSWLQKMEHACLFLAGFWCPPALLKVLRTGCGS